MRKALKFIVPGICILVVAVTFYLMFRLQNEVEEEAYSASNISEDENVVENENVANTENVVDDSNTVDNTTNSTTSANNVVEEEHVEQEEDSTLSTTNQEKAIDLVKDYWGEDNTIYFTNEGVTKEGEYIVAVRQKTSTTVKDYFKVNLESKKVEIYY